LLFSELQSLAFCTLLLYTERVCKRSLTKSSLVVFGIYL
jgi:hypothetical protein